MDKKDRDNEIPAEISSEPRTRNSGIGYLKMEHPSRRLEMRTQGFGIGGGYERAYKKDIAESSDTEEELYGPLPHAGYYGAGTGVRRFKQGQAGFQDELTWYKEQFGKTTSRFKKS